MVDLSSSPTLCLMNVTEIAETRSFYLIHDWIGTPHENWFPKGKI